jgi:hypothetical protein
MRVVAQSQLPLTAAVHLSYLVIAVAVTSRLWAHPYRRMLSANETDHQQFQWFLAHAAWALTHLHNPLLTGWLNVPDQVNLMGNTAILGLGLPLTPITLWLGPQVSFAVALTFTLAATAGAWYWLLVRHLVSSRPAAYLGGGFCGFAPGMVSQASGHPNLTAQFLVPVIVWRLIRLPEPGRVIRNGIILGLLITYQVFVNEEILFLTALGAGVFVLSHAAQHWRASMADARPFLSGLAVAGVTAGLLLAYPFWVQFLGPGRYHGLPFALDTYVTDLGSYPAIARGSLAGTAAEAQRVTTSATEENTFFGWPLLLLVAVILGWLWRRVLVRSIAVTGLVFAALSVGPTIMVYGQSTGVPGPLRVLGGIPPFDLATPTRYALGLIPVVGVLLALGCAEVPRLARRALSEQGPAGRGRWVYGAWLVALAVALIPIAPTTLPAVDRPVPRFITDGGWRGYTSGGRTVVSVPVARFDEMDGMRWAAVTNIGFAIPRGYFMGPRSHTSNQASWDPPLRPTSTLFYQVAHTGKVPAITTSDRAAARADLRYWHAGVVLVTPTQKYAPALVDAVTALIGPGEWDAAGGVWRWDVRALTS